MYRWARIGHLLRLLDGSMREFAILRMYALWYQGESMGEQSGVWPTRSGGGLPSPMR